MESCMKFMYFLQVAYAELHIYRSCKTVVSNIIVPQNLQFLQMFANLAYSPC